MSSESEDAPLSILAAGTFLFCGIGLLLSAGVLAVRMVLTGWGRIPTVVAAGLACLVLSLLAISIHFYFEKWGEAA